VIVIRWLEAWGRKDGHYQSPSVASLTRKMRRESSVPINGNLARSLAHYALIVWGDTIALRNEEPVKREIVQSGYNAHDPKRPEKFGRGGTILAPTHSNYARATKDDDAPQDDPNEAAFWFIQVERLLDELGKPLDGSNFYRAFAIHRYAQKRKQTSFADGQKIDREIIKNLSRCFDETWNGQVPQSVLREAFLTIKAERQESKNETAREARSSQVEKQIDLRQVGAESASMRNRRGRF